jgi:hypothetical protein
VDDTDLAPGVRAFLTTYRQLGGDPDDWAPEYHFAAEVVGRGPGIRARLAAARLQDWRADLAHVPAKVLVEVDGGIWTGGRHVNGTGYTNDCVKLNAATALGWACYRLTTAMASDPDQVGAILAAVTSGDGREEVDNG